MATAEIVGRNAADADRFRVLVTPRSAGETRVIVYASDRQTQTSISFRVAVGTAADDSIGSSLLADVVFGLCGDDSLVGGSRTDALCDGGGKDRLVGGAGADSLFGGAGADILNGRTGGDLLDGGAGSDDLRGDAGSDGLFGRGGNDHLSVALAETSSPVAPAGTSWSTSARRTSGADTHSAARPRHPYSGEDGGVSARTGASVVAAGVSDPAD